MWNFFSPRNLDGKTLSLTKIVKSLREESGRDNVAAASGQGSG